MRQHRKQGKSIFQFIFAAMLIVLGIEVALLIGTLYFGNVGMQMNRNAIDILKKQVENRQNYLQNTLEETQNISSLAGTINTAVENQTAVENISVEELVNNEDRSTELLETVSDSLINVMRHRSVNGIFVILNTDDLDEREIDSFMPCVYIRDQDPTTTASERNYDLLLERSPVKLVKSLGISTDRGWMPAIKYKGYGKNGIVYPVFQTAYKDSEKLNVSDYGHWTPVSYTLEGDDRPVIAYSIPLILSDGTVYGVVGVEMMTSYIQELIPYEELQNSGTGTYLLAETADTLSDSEISVNVINPSSRSNRWLSIPDEEIKMTRTEKNIYEAEIWKENYIASVYPLTLYNKNAPFSDEQWLLVGIVQDKNLYAFTNHIMLLVKLTIFATLLFGLLSSFIVSRRLAKPVARLSDEVEAAQQNQESIPNLSETGIRELDKFSTAITGLSREVLNTSTKFLRIMEMASVELGGFEVRSENESVYVTDNFFSMLGKKELSEKSMTGKDFMEFLDSYNKSCHHTVRGDGSRVYSVIHNSGEIRYVRMEIKTEPDRQIGLVEDVTKVTRERMNIEHERDYDTLTGLYNRRAFQRESEKLFREHPEKLKHAAFVMIDMDNLKYTNDNFGHDFGDRYIHEAGRGFAEYVPDGTLCSRISGDEFNLLFYGYDSQDEIRKAISEVKAALDRKYVELPSGRKLHLSISGGISWYPEDSADLKTLKKYADFAMYQVKRSRKGHFREFELDVYNKNAGETQLRKQFLQLMKREDIAYYYQPIVSAVTGKIRALEALMHVEMSMLKSPEDVLRLAKEEKCLHDLERITFFCAAEGYCRLRANGKVRGDELLFVNSIASEYMTDEECREFRQRYLDIRSQLVLEITEQELLSKEALERKTSKGFLGAVALDDYGSGYNSEKSLLALSPKYIKVDMVIIRDIDTDIDKQQIVANIVKYAHQRGMYIVAEGVETAEELKKVLELEVDLLQGYYLSRPAATPGAINPDALKIIEENRKR